MGDQSAYVPTRTKATGGQNFYTMAKEKGWTDEQLRRSYDLPKTALPPGVALVKHNFDLIEVKCQAMLNQIRMKINFLLIRIRLKISHLLMRSKNLM